LFDFDIEEDLLAVDTEASDINLALDDIFPEGQIDPDSPVNIPGAKPSEDSKQQKTQNPEGMDREEVLDMAEALLTGSAVQEPAGDAESELVEPSQADDASTQFEAGDRVSHETYGEGVIRRVIPMDGRVILNIQFDQVGKRLLDQSLSKLERLK
jgi:hypothetical protein